MFPPFARLLFHGGFLVLSSFALFQAISTTAHPMSRCERAPTTVAIESNLEQSYLDDPGCDLGILRDDFQRRVLLFKKYR